MGELQMNTIGHLEMLQLSSSTLKSAKAQVGDNHDKLPVFAQSLRGSSEIGGSTDEVPKSTALIENGTDTVLKSADYSITVTACGIDIPFAGTVYDWDHVYACRMSCLGYGKAKDLPGPFAYSCFQPGSPGVCGCHKLSVGCCFHTPVPVF